MEPLQAMVANGCLDSWIRYDEILEIADNMDTLPGYYPEGLSIESDWKRVEEIVSHYK
jgi:hypothetical protein